MDKATTASFWPITLAWSVSSSFNNLSDSPSVIFVTGIPVIVETTAATSSTPTVGLFASCVFFQESWYSLILSLICASRSLKSDAFSNSWFLIASSFSLIVAFNSFSSSFPSGGRLETFKRTFEAASSIRSIALSGKNLSVINLLESSVAAIIASSDMNNLWCSSYFGFKPLIIWIVSSIEGCSTRTIWKRLSRAESFSICFLYSSSVVAPITWISPRLKAGFNMLAASMAPSAAPAPIRVCISSITRIMFPAWRISSIIFLRRSSNSPLYFVPATKRPISSWIIFLFSKISGTSQSIIFIAKPWAIAVLPTPGSPIKIGLFFVRRAKIWITLSISFSLPTTGSSLCSCAARVKSVPNSSKLGVFALDWGAPAVVVWGPWPVLDSPSSFMTLLRHLFRSTPKFSRTFAATPSPSLINPKRRCSVPM